MKRKTKAKPKAAKQPADEAPSVTIQELLADAHAEYRRAREAKDDEPSKAHVEAFHRAMGLLNRLEKEIKVMTPVAGVMTRKR